VEEVFSQAIPNLFTPGIITSTRCGMDMDLSEGGKLSNGPVGQNLIREQCNDYHFSRYNIVPVSTA
jgi:hypothetical protein